MAVVDVVKYNGGHDVFAWKFPKEDLSTWTQLIVNETQEAILFKEGKALDVFGAGRHVLDTQNIPILSGILKLPFGKKSPFTAEIWFVNKTYSLDVKWGTPTPIQLADKKYDVMIPIRAHGQFGIQIADTKKFLLKLVGTTSEFDKDTLQRFFRGIYVTKVKDSITSYLVKHSISVMEINAYLDELSSFMLERIAPFFDDYGIELVNFFVNGISIPEDDPAVVKINGALAKKAEMNIIGYDYKTERTFDTLESASSNPGSAGDAMGGGMGIGMGVAMGQSMGNMFGDLGNVLSVKETEAVACEKCGSAIGENMRFCPGCGTEAKQLKQAERLCSCGASVSSEFKFCPSCGKPLEAKCPGCDAAVDSSSRFCHKCGHKLD